MTEPKDRWEHRRRMAYACLLSALLFPLLVLLNKDLASIAGAHYIFVGSVVGAYIGFATADDKWQKDR